MEPVGTITLRKHEERRLHAGHLWAFSNEIARLSGQPEAGDLVRLLDFKENLIGVGFYHPRSLIAVRLLAREPVADLSGLLRDRLLTARRLRERLYPGATAYRLCHGEGDFLPGLFIDRYDDVYVLQVTAAGMERVTPTVVALLREHFGARAVVERNDLPLRTLEGLEPRTGLLEGTLPDPLTIAEAGVTYAVDVLHGQKTGHFFDQRETRRRVAELAAGAEVLDAYCCTGGFGLHAAKAGARRVTAIDSSEEALARAAANAAANGVAEQVEFLEANVFEALRAFKKDGRRFDLVIVDPPAFTKSKKDVVAAKRGYRSLLGLAAQAVAPGGLLVACSCSHHILPETLREIVAATIRPLRRPLQLLEWRGQAPDHPILPGMPETAYLKVGIYRVG